MEMNKEQLEAFNQIENFNDNVLLFGKPGVGKSFLINKLVTDGKKRYTLAAPTGLAALNIGGKTLHSLFRLPISEGLIGPDYPINIPDNVMANLKYKVKHLIVDEVSMVRVDMLDYIDRILREVHENSLPFGGIQVILVGDFFQLPPVILSPEKTQLRKYDYASPFIFDSHAFSTGLFQTITLNEVVRQSGDQEFLKLLDNARLGKVGFSQILDLNDLVGDCEDFRIRLTSTNKQADSINQKFLKDIPMPIKVYTAKSFGEWPAYPVPNELSLKVGAQVMVKMNGADRPPGDYQSASLVVNGSIGIIIDFNEDSVRLELDTGEEVNIYCKRWERKVKTKDENGFMHEEVVAAFEQYPLQLSWAISIHKSQGQTFERIHIDASRIFAPGQLYVAISRCKTMEGLSFEAPINKRKFFTDRDVLRFYNNLT